MKTKNLLCKAFLLLALLGGVNSAWANTSTFPLQKNAEGYTLSKDGITFSGGSESKDGYNVNSTTLTVTASADITITQIEFTVVSTRLGGTITCSTGTYSSGTWSDFSLSNGSATLTSTANWRLTQAVVTYTASSGGGAPTINTQPASATYLVSDTPSDLTVEATASDGDLSYKWFSCNDANKTNPVALSADYTTTASYTPSTAAPGVFYYFVNVKDGKGDVDSDVASITVNAASAPTISVSGAPVGDIVTGTEVTLTATLTGAPSPTILWYSNTAASTSDGTEIDGATNETYAPSTETPGTYYYYAVASNSQGSATSELQTLVVKDKVATPTFTPNGAYFDGASQSITIECATGGATIQYSTDDGDTWNNYTGEFNVTTTTTVKAKATKDGCIDSEEASATFTKVSLTPQADVTGAITWDWSDVTNSSAVDFTNTSLSNYEVTFANISAYGFTAVTGLAAQDALLMNGQRSYNNANGSKHCQVNYLKFNTTVPGKVTVEYANTGTKAERTVKVNNTKGSKGSETNSSYQSETFAVEAGEVTIAGVQVSDDAASMLRIRKVVFTPVVKATIGTYGYATLSSQFDMDFTTPIEGLTAYKAVSATESTITLEEVTGKVKAGDGLVIKGAAGTYTIPTTTGATTIYTNKSTITMWGYNGDATETVTKASTGTNFVLSVQSGQVVFAPVDGTDATLNPGQAALWANVTISEARALRISFGDEASGIESVSREVNSDGSVFSLSGQRVAQPTKGLYIVNGKKVIIK